MKIIQKLKGLLILFIIGALLFINIIPSFAADNLKYYYDDLNRLYRVENTTTGKLVEYQYDEVGNRLQKGVYNFSYTITATANSNGSISPANAVTVPYKSSQTFTITANSGYVVADVVVDTDQHKGAITSYTFSNVTANHTISASFSPIPTYTITASAGSNGSISPSGAVVVNQGSSQTFTITPNSGYAVADVVVDTNQDKGAITSYIFSSITANHTISASFIQAGDVSIGSTYYISLQAAYDAASDGATIKVTAKTITANINMNRNISVNLEGGYDVTHTSIIGNTTLIGMIQTYSGGGTLTIKNFILQQSSYSITATAGSNGSISPAGVTTVASGGNQTYTITPATGYTIANVLVDGSSVGAVTSYTFSNVTAAHTISASFVSSLDSYTKLLLHMDGTNGSTTFTDSSSGAKTVTAVGNTQISTATKKFGTGSVLFNGTTDYLTIPGSSDWYLGAEDFTIDTWFYIPTGTSWPYSGAFLGQYQDVDNYWGLYIFSVSSPRSEQIRFTVRISGVNIGVYLLFPFIPANSTWYHLAVVRAAGVIQIYINGVQQSFNSGSIYMAVSQPMPNFSTAPLSIGHDSNSQIYFNGNLDEVHIVKGIALYTSNFTPPTSPY